MRHVITHDNYGEAVDAVRDILMVYFDMSEGFGHAADTYARFDPLKYLNAESGDDRYYFVDLDLLRSGSAILILCAFYDLWCEEQNMSNHPRTNRYKDALEEGRLAAFPDIEKVIKRAVAADFLTLTDPWFDDAVEPIHEKYVRGLFKSLAASRRGKTSIKWPFYLSGFALVCVALLLLN